MPAVALTLISSRTHSSLLPPPPVALCSFCPRSPCFLPLLSGTAQLCLRLGFLLGTKHMGTPSFAWITSIANTAAWLLPSQTAALHGSMASRACASTRCALGAQNPAACDSKAGGGGWEGAETVGHGRGETEVVGSWWRVLMAGRG